MDPVTVALLAIATLVKNPALGGGGLRADQTVRLINVLVQLIQGGRKTAQALRAFAEEITRMAETGYQPVERDFKAFEDRLAAAMAVVQEAKQRVESRKPKPAPAPPEENTQDNTSNGEAGGGPSDPPGDSQ